MKLYANEDENDMEQNLFLENHEIKVAEKDVAMLDKELSENELYEWLNELKSNKTSGFDGITKDFWVEIEEFCEIQKRGAIRLEGEQGWVKKL